MIQEVFDEWFEWMLEVIVVSASSDVFFKDGVVESIQT